MSQITSSNSLEQQTADDGVEEEAKKALLDVFNKECFLKNQLPVMKAALTGKDVYAVMPATSGKNACYQAISCVDLYASGGTTVVLSPFRALFEDQIKGLRGLGIDAFSIDSSQGLTGKTELMSRVIGDALPGLMFMTPEFALRSEYATDLLDHLYNASELARFVVDDADIVSILAMQDHADHHHLSIFRHKYPKTPLLCITQSPSRRLRENLFKALDLNPERVEVVSSDLELGHLTFEVVDKEDKVEDMVERIHKDFADKSGIIYCRTRKEAQDVAATLRENYIKADHYHAQRTDRDEIQKRWEEKDIKVLVTTIAFGSRGLKNNDATFIFHHSIPQSIDDYASRAVAACRGASCILYYSESDVERVRYHLQIDTLDPEEDHAYNNVISDHPRTLQSYGKELDKIQSDNTTKWASRFKLNRFIQMIRYANDHAKCRKRIILNYYGLEDCEERCAELCDNCKRSNNETNTELVDVTRYASYALRLIDDSNELERRITKKQAVECLGGLNNDMLRRKRLLALKSYGIMEKKSLKTIELILTALETRYIIGRIPVKQPKEGEYMHLRVFSRSLATAVHEGRLKIKLPDFLVTDRTADDDDDFLSVMDIDFASVNDMLRAIESEDAGTSNDNAADDLSESSSSKVDAMSEASSLLVVSPQPGPSILMTVNKAVKIEKLPTGAQAKELSLNATIVPAKRSSTSRSDKKKKKRQKRISQ